MSQPHYTPQAAHCGFCLPAEQADDALLVRGTTRGPRHTTAVPHTRTEEAAGAQQKALLIISSLSCPLLSCLSLQRQNTFSKSRREPLVFVRLWCSPLTFRMRALCVCV